MKSIGIVTTSRADYGIYRPLLRQLSANQRFRLLLFVSGTHLSRHHGFTVQEIMADGFPIHERVESLLASDTPEGIAKSIGLGCIGFAQAYARMRPDWLVLLGDRFEMFAAGLAALPFNLPILHLHGGELTEGAIDDALRHSLTKLSHLHGVATQAYRDRVVQLGEEPWRVHVTGALSLDNLTGFNPMTRGELESQFDLNLAESPLLVTFHPVTTEYEQTGEQIEQLLAALADQTIPIVLTLPNADTHGSIIRDHIERFCHSHPSARLVKNFGQRAYFSMMNHSAAMVGNSSSGIIEAASFTLPVVNVGSRQQGRVCPANVINVPPLQKAIRLGIQQALSGAFRSELKHLKNPYGDGHAAGRILDLLSKTFADEKLTKKRFHTLPPGHMT